jgi:ABC-type branched-subunit amino acid transport system ATPase component
LILRIQRELGCSIVIIEHDIRLVRSVADRLLALESGLVIAEGSPADVMADAAVVASYLGTDPAAIAHSGHTDR